MDVTLRAVTTDDEPFLRQVYASTRADELASVPWTAEQKTAFCDMQYDAQERDYRSRWPDMRYEIIVVDGAPAGRLWQSFTPDEAHVLDIAILPEFRGQGAGRHVLQHAIDEARATNRMFSIYVEKTNPARRLYERLGLRVVAEGELYDRMEIPAPS
jgi:ribosomal protein S18 acetylase RimI-like enzyme